MKPLNVISPGPGALLKKGFRGTFRKFDGYCGIVCWLALVLGVLGLPAMSGFAQSIVPTNTYTFMVFAGSFTDTGSADGTGPNALFNDPQGIAVDTNYNVYVADSGNNTIRKLVDTSTNWLVSTIAGFSAAIYTADDFSTNGVGPQNPTNQDYYTTSNNYTAGQITNVYTNWFGAAFSNVVFSLSNVNNNPSNGSMQVNLDWTPGSQFALHHADYSDNPGISSLTYTSVEMDVRWDPNSATGTGNDGYATFGPLRLGVRPHAIYNIQDWFYTTNIPSSVTNWVHINAPLSPTDTNQENWGELLIGADSSITGSNLNGGATFYVDNIRFIPKPASGSNDGTGTNALFNNPLAITVDQGGNLYVADTGNSTIRKLSLSGTNWAVTTIAGFAGTTGTNDGTGTNALFNHPEGITVDTNGNVFVADTINDTLRMLTLSGTNYVVSTISGAPKIAGTNDGSNAEYNSPEGITVYHHSGLHLFVADTTNDTIRNVTYNVTNWSAATIAGLAGVTGSADGTNNDARFFDPGGITVDTTRNLYVADTGNQTIRKITQPFSPFVVTTIAGVPGVAGHANGNGTNALFTNPMGIYFSPVGQVFVADTGGQGATVYTSALLGGVPLVPGPGQSGFGLITTVLGPISASNSSGAYGILAAPNSAATQQPMTNWAYSQEFSPGSVVVFSNISGWYLPTNQTIVTPNTFFTANLSYYPGPPMLVLSNDQSLWMTGTVKTAYYIQYTTNLAQSPINWKSLTVPGNANQPWTTPPLTKGTNWVQPAPVIRPFPWNVTNVFYRAVWTNE
jgi:hypothetical protein